jgi:hypothetical protein
MNTLNINDLQRIHRQWSPLLKPLNMYQPNNGLMSLQRALLGSSSDGVLSSQALLPALNPSVTQQLLSLFPTVPVRGLHEMALLSNFDPQQQQQQPQLTKKGVAGRIEPFPEKLHRLLREVEAVGRSDMISFVADDTFKIHDPVSTVKFRFRQILLSLFPNVRLLHLQVAFFRAIVPRYFRQTKLTSFKRQLKLYGFELVSCGPNRGAYRHELFSRSNPLKCRDMIRVAIKTPKSSQAKNNKVARGNESADDTPVAPSSS